jgi:hypothetical protein
MSNEKDLIDAPACFNFCDRSLGEMLLMTITGFIVALAVVTVVVVGPAQNNYYNIRVYWL